MGIGMRQVESAADDMAELVMQRHADRAETHAAKPGAVQRLRPGLAVLRVGDNCRQGAAHRADRLLGHHRDNRVPILGIKRLNRVRDSIGTGGNRQPLRQAER